MQSLSTEMGLKPQFKVIQVQELSGIKFIYFSNFMILCTVNTADLPYIIPDYVVEYGRANLLKGVGVMNL